MNEENSDLKLKDIEKFKREIKSKRCALDQDNSIVRELVDMIDYENVVTK